MLLLYVGRLVPEKNLGLLFEMMERLASISSRDFRLYVVGEGMERKRWEQRMAKSIPGRVRFLGHTPDRERLADLYANADLFVHPNAREPFGIAPLEAMASGLPVLLPNSGGVLAYANDQNAWLAPPTVDHFTAAVERCLANRKLREQRIAAGLKTAESFRWETVAAKFLDLYTEFYRIAQGEPATLPPDFVSSPANEAQSPVIRMASRLASWGYSVGSRSLAYAFRTVGPRGVPDTTPPAPLHTSQNS